MDNHLENSKYRNFIFNQCDLIMNIFTFHKVISFIRSVVYLIAFFACVFTAYSFSGNVNSVQVDEKFSLRIMTYNIHHGEGIDGVVNLERIAKIINQENPDILLLQEVDVNLDRSGNVDIPTYFTEKTELENIVFGKNLDIEDGGYGNATLSRFPFTSSNNFHFKKIGPEQRGVLITEISTNGRKLLVLNSHFDHSEDDSERIFYAEKIIDKILPEYNADAVLFGGDFNDIPTSRMYRKLMEEFEDTWKVSGQGEGFTIPADQPSKRIDYILFEGNIKPDSIWVPQTEASDHLPVVADFVLVDDN